MIRMAGLITRVYSLLLRLYPREFRDEFAAEMQRVLIDSMADAAKHGMLPLISICLRELGDLPGAALREHCHARSKAMMQNKSRLSRVELLGAAIPFLLYLALPMGEVFPSLALYWGGAVILRQNWPVWFQWHAVVEATLIGVTSTACTWFWVMVIVFLPALFGLRPRSTRLPTATHL